MRWPLRGVYKIQPIGWTKLIILRDDATVAGSGDASGISRGICERALRLGPVCTQTAEDVCVS